MKKVISLVLGTVIALSMFVGCASKDNKEATNNTKTTEQKSNGTKGEDGYFSSFNNKVKPEKVGKYWVWKEQATPNLDKLLEEEAKLQKEGNIKAEDGNKYPTEAVNNYINGKYDKDKIAVSEVGYSKVSENEMVYHMILVDIAKSRQNKRNITVKQENSTWKVTSDEEIK